MFWLEPLFSHVFASLWYFVPKFFQFLAITTVLFLSYEPWTHNTIPVLILTKRSPLINKIYVYEIQKIINHAMSWVLEYF